VPIKPFVLGGEGTLANLEPEDCVSAMRWHGELASQIRDLPDGARLVLKERGQ
jgi:hypothetical protein